MRQDRKPACFPHFLFNNIPGVWGQRRDAAAKATQ